MSEFRVQYGVYGEGPNVEASLHMYAKHICKLAEYICHRTKHIFKALHISEGDGSTVISWEMIKRDQSRVIKVINQAVLLKREVFFLILTNMTNRYMSTRIDVWHFFKDTGDSSYTACCPNQSRFYYTGIFLSEDSAKKWFKHYNTTEVVRDLEN